MCGIAGTIGTRDTTAVHAMLDAQRHRGPDGRHVWQAPGEPFILGHDRLAIIDVAGGEQPIPNEDRSLYVAVNGEIYNHEALRAGLRGRHRFRTGSDSEVLLHLYEELGPEAVGELDGMFAAAIWGPESGLFLARDPLGIKPLYYGRDGANTLFFGSEIKALVDHVPMVKEFRNGHYWTEDTGRVKYYSVPLPQDQIADERAAVDMVEQTLVEAIHKRLMTDVPLGVFLSGGLDSSLIAAVMRKHRRGELLSF
ncbi:MAG TPA: asparagine synthase-related protein, partial [Armatimonadota bacterium]|nr:asparagine synthase-related protein [Armatimonadota bacterium]